MIGDHKAPLNAALGRDFGLFPMDFRLRGVSRHGGAIVEAFDTDDFREMTPIQRYVAAERVSQVIADHVCSVAGGGRGRPPGVQPHRVSQRPGLPPSQGNQSKDLLTEANEITTR